MRWGFRRRAGLFGGLVHLNISKHGLGASVGVPGLRVGLSSQHRAYVRGGVPGTGLFFTQNLPHHDNSKSHAGLFALAVLAACVVLWIIGTLTH